MRYSDIIGQQHIKEYFQSAVINKTVSHAYIINGEKSSGKMMLAKVFALSLMCDAGGSEPCLECESCKRSVNNSNPDLINLVKDKKRATDIIGINEIREQIISNIYERPYNGEHKVYIIDDADKMNVNAQNAILKTLEEPPDYAVLILITTNASRLLPTIISRCVVLNIRPVADDVIRQFLKERYLHADTDIDVITAMSGGNVGKAKLLSEDEQFNEFQTKVIDILSDIPKTDYRRVIDGVELLGRIKSEKKYTAEEIFGLFTLWYRDILLFKAIKDTDNLIFKNKATEIAVQSTYFRYDKLEDIIKLINDAASKVKSNINYEAVMELLLVNIQEMSK